MNQIIIIILSCIIFSSIAYSIGLRSRIKNLEDRLKVYLSSKNKDSIKQIEDMTGNGDSVSSIAMMALSIIIKNEDLEKERDKAEKELNDLREQVREMSEVANKDGLTGIRNEAAFVKELSKLDWEAAYGSLQYAIAVIDIVSLRSLNSKYGYEAGNEDIKRLCRMICERFAHSPVFRIGSGKFAIILKNDDYVNRGVLVQDIRDELLSIASDPALEDSYRFSTAMGVAVYNPSGDQHAEMVYNRAEMDMENSLKNGNTEREEI